MKELELSKKRYYCLKHLNRWEFYEINLAVEKGYVKNVKLLHPYMLSHEFAVSAYSKEAF